MYVCMYVCMCVCVCLCVFVYIRSEIINLVHIILQQNFVSKNFPV